MKGFVIKPLKTRPGVYKMDTEPLKAYKKYILKYKKYILEYADVPPKVRKPYIERCKREFERIVKRQHVIHLLVTKILKEEEAYRRNYIPPVGYKLVGTSTLVRLKDNVVMFPNKT